MCLASELGHGKSVVKHLPLDAPVQPEGASPPGDGAAAQGLSSDAAEAATLGQALLARLRWRRSFFASLQLLVRVGVWACTPARALSLCLLVTL